MCSDSVNCRERGLRAAASLLAGGGDESRADPAAPISGAVMVQAAPCGARDLMAEGPEAYPAAQDGVAGHISKVGLAGALCLWAIDCCSVRSARRTAVSLPPQTQPVSSLIRWGQSTSPSVGQCPNTTMTSSVYRCDASNHRT
jgi:hypothetical protein